MDGKRVVIEGKDEIVLQCGQASITLRRNGKVIIKGTYVESHASGTQRIKGVVKGNPDPFPEPASFAAARTLPRAAAGRI